MPKIIVDSFAGGGGGIATRMGAAEVSEGRKT